ncbi:ATP-binding protein [Planococcus maritimus]|uniref:ATP-binding protein n=1 Tax=Planococcus maritimus TaxID=192421 RepID=UPI00232DFA09|nr:ATP-binding protein [Planococcus maritimus]
MGNIPLSFLQPGIEQIRKSIHDIDDSYNNEWDILAELLQNAVDAIRKNKSSDESIIEITIDSVKREIKVHDSGIGIEQSRLPILLKPFSTDKDNDPNSVGEKGVGLTFVIFSCNYFEIKTSFNGMVTKAVIKDASTWKQSSDAKELLLNVEDVQEEYTGTTVTMKNVENSSIFDLTFEQLRFVLRTRTILGNTHSIWENDINIDIYLKYIDQNNDEFEDVLPYKYLLLPETLNNNEKISLKDFIENYSDALKTDAEKRAALNGKVIYYDGKFTHNNNREIKFYSYFMPGRAMWDLVSKHWGLITDDKIDDEEYNSNFHYALLKPGIFTSVKGMPTGITINNPKTGYSGYWSNIFIIFEDASLKFDIGRKSIHGQQSLILQKYAKEIFNQYLKYITKYVSRESVSLDSEWDKEEVFGEIEEMVDLKSSNTLFVKSPKGQEAQVSAMFYEQAAKGIIKDLKFLTTGYKGKYDLYAKWGRKKVVIEFKAELKNIMRDFNDEQKLFDEIDCIVCWDVSEEDEKILKSRSISIDEIKTSRFEENKVFPNATHILNLGGMTKPIYIIDLKKIFISQSL